MEEFLKQARKFKWNWILNFYHEYVIFLQSEDPLFFPDDTYFIIAGIKYLDGGCKNSLRTL